MAQTVTLQLPEAIYERVKRTAEATKRPLEDVLLKTLESALPPSVEDLPIEYQGEFTAMESLNDEELWNIAESKIPTAQQSLYSRLLSKNQAGTLKDIEKRQLSDLGAEARKLTLCKAHAYALLKWRGHRIPTLAELGKSR